MDWKKLVSTKNYACDMLWQKDGFNPRLKYLLGMCIQGLRR